MQHMLADKNVLVTGGSRGIGREIALAAARAGANVAIAYASADAPAQEVVKVIQSLGRQAVALKCDVGNFQEAASVVTQAAEELGGYLDVVVNNAGITRDKLSIALSETDWDAVLDVNLKGSFAVAQAAAKLMAKRRSGRIINISSVSGLMGNPGQANYAAAKAGLIGLTKTMAKELAGRNITVNAIAPGFIQTDMTEALSEKIREAVVPMIPLKRFGKPEDIAHAVVFLGSDYANYITGTTLVVDGGLAM